MSTMSALRRKMAPAAPMANRKADRIRKSEIGIMSVAPVIVGAAPSGSGRRQEGEIGGSTNGGENGARCVLATTTAATTAISNRTDTASKANR